MLWMVHWFMRFLIWLAGCHHLTWDGRKTLILSGLLQCALMLVCEIEVWRRDEVRGMVRRIGSALTLFGLPLSQFSRFTKNRVKTTHQVQMLAL
jgi:hypothetical protein